MFEYMPPNEDISSGENHKHIEITFPEDYQFFKGHFPDFALLPGMIQVHLAIQFAKDKFILKGEFLGFKSVKFSSPLIPNEKVVLELEYSPAKKVLNFIYKKNELDFYSKGSILIS